MLYYDVDKSANWISSPYSSGFAEENAEDSLGPQSTGTFHKIKCGTEKGKHKCKNFRTAGIYHSITAQT